MQLKRFIHKITQGVQEFIGEKAVVENRRVTKNNNVILDGLIIRERGQNAAPAIYLQEYYEQYREGKQISTIIYEIIQLYERQKLEGDLDMGFFAEYAQVKDRIAYKLIHYERNKAFLMDVPHIRYLDLAIVFYYMVNNALLTCATIQITKDHCAMWDVAEKELYETAKGNMPRLLPHELKSIGEILQEAQEEFLPGQGTHPMYILGNSQKLFGAISILYDGLLRDFAKTLGTDIFILPSSIHEVVLLPDSGDIALSYLESMVYDVNRTQLEEQEILSDSVYKYVRAYDKIDLVKSAETT